MSNEKHLSIMMVTLHNHGLIKLSPEDEATLIKFIAEGQGKSGALAIIDSVKKSIDDSIANAIGKLGNKKTSSMRYAARL